MAQEKKRLQQNKTKQTYTKRSAGRPRLRFNICKSCRIHWRLHGDCRRHCYHYGDNTQSLWRHYQGDWLLVRSFCGSLTGLIHRDSVPAAFQLYSVQNPSRRCRVWTLNVWLWTPTIHQLVPTKWLDKTHPMSANIEYDFGPLHLLFRPHTLL